MTVIAYRAGILAADSLTCAHGTRVGTAKKIWRGGDGTLLALCGSRCEAADFLEWFLAGERGRPPGGEDWGGTLIRPDGAVFNINASGRMTSVEAEFHTNGAGGFIALGAMDRGATAIEAVESAIRWSTDCGGPVQFERLDRAPGTLVQRFPPTKFHHPWVEGGAGHFERAAAD